MRIDLTFQGNYELEVLNRVEEDKIHYYPAGQLEGGRDGLIVKIVPHYGKSWVGIFAFGETSTSFSGVFTAPDPDKFCVVSKGKGYLITSTNPSIWQMIDTIPITDCHASKTHNILIFANFTDLLAYDDNGIRWRTARLAFDGFKIIKVTDNYLYGEYWDLRNEATNVIQIDIESGNNLGQTVHF